MEMHQVRYFLAAARVLNFTRAAEECHVAQPSLTKAIKQLEQELGGELFRRERNLTHLSELGHRMLPLMQQCYESALAAKQMATSIKKGEVAELVVALPYTLRIELLLPFLKELVRAMPGLTLRFLRGSCNDVCDELKKGSADLAVSPQFSTSWDRLEAWPLFTEAYRLFVAREHRLSRQPSVRIDELLQEQLICRPYCEDYERGIAFLTASGLSVPTAHNAGSDADFIALLGAEMGIGLAPESVAVAGAVSVLSLEGYDMQRTVYIYAVAGRQRSRAANTLIKMLRAADWMRQERSEKAA